jgi:pyrroline-5-carboxylate reductase
MKIGIVGAGKMGSALVKGFLASKKIRNEDLVVCEVTDKRRKEVEEEFKVKTASRVDKWVQSCDIIIIAVKPYDIQKVLNDLKMYKEKRIIIVSVAAGITIDKIKKYLPNLPVIRTMPNLACSVNEGMIAISASKDAKKNEVKKVKELLGLTGKVVEIVDESLMDAVTGLSASGLAFVYEFIYGLEDAGVWLGIPRELSKVLAAQTVLGSAKLVLEGKVHLAELRDMVATPAGTTIEGLYVFEKCGFRGIIMEAVKKAFERAKELRKE